MRSVIVSRACLVAGTALVCWGSVDLTGAVQNRTVALPDEAAKRIRGGQQKQYCVCPDDNDCEMIWASCPGCPGFPPTCPGGMGGRMAQLTYTIAPGCGEGHDYADPTGQFMVCSWVWACYSGACQKVGLTYRCYESGELPNETHGILDFVGVCPDP
jgi:hypothetical protein